MGMVKPQDLESIEKLWLFSGLSRDTLEDLTAGALLQRYPPGTVLFDQGERPDFLHVLLDGSVQLLAVGAEGREVLVEIVTPVDSFILAAALTDTPYLMRARVHEAARILLLPTDRLRSELSARPELALTMLASLAGHFRRMVRQVKNLKLRTTVQRVGCFILELSHSGTPTQENGDTGYRLPYDKQLIASHLGMTRESLSRALAALRDVGVRTRGDVVFLDAPDKLAEFCSPDALIDGVENDLRIPIGDS